MQMAKTHLHTPKKWKNLEFMGKTQICEKNDVISHANIFMTRFDIVKLRVGWLMQIGQI